MAHNDGKFSVMALTTLLLGTALCPQRPPSSLFWGVWSTWFMWQSLNLHAVRAVWGDRGTLLGLWQPEPLGRVSHTTEGGRGALGALGCHQLCLCPGNPHTSLTVPGVCRTGTASVCPRFCSSQHSPVCLHTVPRAEQTAHGDSQQLAGRDSPGCVPRPASPAPPTAGFAIKTQIQFELGGCRWGILASHNCHSSRVVVGCSRDSPACFQE